jgi:hypothetical protein
MRPASASINTQVAVAAFVHEATISNDSRVNGRSFTGSRPAREIDHESSADVDGDCGAELAELVEVALERVDNRLEARLDRPSRSPRAAA